MKASRLLLIIFTMLVFFSCKKKDVESVLGLDVQPENDLLGITVTDSTALYMHTQRVDSVRTYNDQFKFLGSVQDSAFGQTHASIYANYSIANNLTNVSYGVNSVLDSSEIVLRFTGLSNGNLNTSLTYDLYLLNEKIQSGVSYYTNQQFIKTKYATKQTQLVVRDGAVCLVLPFDNQLAQYILQNPANLINNAAFLNSYKGIYITSINSTLSSTNRGALRKYDLDDAISGVNIYYHNSGSISSKGEKAHFSFKGSEALRVNHIDHNYTTALPDLFQQVIGNDTTKGGNKLFINTFGSTRLKVYLPFLKSFADSQNVSISRAELILKVDEAGYNANFDYPDNLALIAIGPGSVEELVYDQLETSDLIKYNANYDSKNKQYVFNIARQMQKIITGKVYNYGFYLINAQPSRAYVIKRDDRYKRVIFGGKNNINYTPKFRVTYIKYPYDK